jgi:hypothetical protein
VYATRDGNKGYPNELRCRTPGGNSTGAVIVMRVYAFDPASPDRTDEWGAVPPPVVKVRWPR